ncbi:unnamed protein product [Rangifer tarandus platyrhynchus]|uniref:Uncharacterized protein n=2 Tax=Rangifer tarandus platyrhynchus TaxID=3082113 RepID=A0ABN9A022_RANTA|nr:unnamed protein product [Rangifer tarandus platyrhynchus]CAI9713670.1 unnamed protein product [Rangifer tarandus platyrhynchus]
MGAVPTSSSSSPILMEKGSTAEKTWRTGKTARNRETQAGAPEGRCGRMWMPAGIRRLRPCPSPTQSRIWGRGLSTPKVGPAALREPEGCAQLRAGTKAPGSRPPRREANRGCAVNAKSQASAQSRAADGVLGRSPMKREQIIYSLIPVRVPGAG